MANSYTQLYIQIVFAVNGRANLLPKAHKDNLHRYITGVIQERNHKLLAINSVRDHIHIFIGLNPSQSISELVNNIKTASTKFIKKQAWMKHNFSWQKGYGAFSYSRDAIGNVANYIARQEEHHAKQNFRKEYIALLNKYDVPFKEQYLFDFFDVD